MPRATRIGKETYQTAAVAYDEVTKAYFIHDQQIYPVASAPASIFRAAVLTLAPEWRTSSVLASKKIDLVSRWWLSCELSETGRAMILYASREEAERSLRDQAQPMDNEASMGITG